MPVTGNHCVFDTSHGKGIAFVGTTVIDGVDAIIDLEQAHLTGRMVEHHRVTVEGVERRGFDPGHSYLAYSATLTVAHKECNRHPHADYGNDRSKNNGV